MPGHSSPTTSRVRRWLLATVAVPAVALAGVLAWPGGGERTSPAAAVEVPIDATVADGPATVPTVGSAAVLSAVGAAAAQAGGSIAVVVLDAAGAPLVTGDAADDAVPTASLVKLLVVQQLLARDAAGSLSLDDDDLALMERAVEASDDDAMSSLWVEFDGAALVADAAAEFGLTGTAPPETAGQWGGSTTTARDQATFLAALDEHLSPADLATLTGWMQATTGTAADGFDQAFGVLATGSGAGPVAAKQGWMCCVDSRRQLHSAGVLADGRVVVLLGDFPSGTGWAEARAALDAAARAAVTAG